MNPQTKHTMPLAELTAKASPGPLGVDTIDNDGQYGDGGPDPRTGFKSFAIFDANGRAMFDSLNRHHAISEVHEDHGDESSYAWDEPARLDAAYLAHAANHLPALVEALETIVDLVARAQGSNDGMEGLEAFSLERTAKTLAAAKAVHLP